MSKTLVPKSQRKRPRREVRDATAMVIHHKQQLLANAYPIEDLPDESPADVMQLLINRVTFLCRAAAAEADRLKPGLAQNQSKSELEHELWSSWDAEGNRIVMANFWVEHEAKLRAELARLTEKAQALDLTDRRTRVQETQYRILGEALKNACVAAGIPETQQRKMGAALRTELAALESGTAA